MYQIKPLGEHRGNKRLWFETTALNDVGLTPGTKFRVVHKRCEKGYFLSIVPDPNGDRTVSKKVKGDKVIPIIDICSSKELGELANEKAVKAQFRDGQIIVSKLSSAELAEARAGRLKKHLASAVLTMAALCMGGAVMDHAAAQGLNDAGLRSELAVGVEIDESLVEHVRLHNPVVKSTTQLYSAPMQELAQDDAAMQALPQVDILVTGIPCSGASISGKSKLGLNFAEDHPEVGHLVVPYFMLLHRLNPAAGVVECVSRYKDTASAQIMRQMFRDMGYDFQEVVLNAWDFGSIEERKRWFMVFYTHGVHVDLRNLVPPNVTHYKLRHYLDNQPLEAYREMPGLHAKELRDIEAGKGFKMQIVTGETEKIGVIGRDYTKNRSTEPKVQHPRKPELLRLLTPAEHARIKGLPVECLEGLSVTAAHQLLGQSVDTRPVRAIFERLGEALLAWDGAVQTVYREKVAA